MVYFFGAQKTQKKKCIKQTRRVERTERCFETEKRKRRKRRTNERKKLSSKLTSKRDRIKPENGGSKIGFPFKFRTEKFGKVVNGKMK